MKRQTDLKRSPAEIKRDLDMHYGCLEEEKPSEQAVKDFNRPAYGMKQFKKNKED